MLGGPGGLRGTSATRLACAIGADARACPSDAETNRRHRGDACTHGPTANAHYRGDACTHGPTANAHYRGDACTHGPTANAHASQANLNAYCDARLDPRGVRCRLR